MKKLERINGEKVDLILTKATEAIPEKNWLPACYYDIVLHGTNTKIGFCDARIGHNENIYYGGNIGYSVNEEYRGNGFAVEAVHLLKHVFLANGIHKIYITNNPDNKASFRVCEKAGAKFLETVVLPPHNNMRIEDGDTHKNIFELIF